MKVYAIVMTIAFLSQFLLVMIYADKLRKKEREVLLSENLVTPVFAKVEIRREDLAAVGRAEGKLGAELVKELRELGCIRVYQVYDKRSYIETISCIVLAKPLELN